MDTESKVRSLELVFHYDLFKSVLINLCPQVFASVLPSLA